MAITGGHSFLMFMALFALYSPLAALTSYLPIVGRFNPRDQLRLAIGLFVNVSIFTLLAVWIGEPLLEVLGITTAALAVTGGVALLYAGVPMMRGIDEAVEDEHAPGASASETADAWRSVLFTPVTFPLTVGGTSFGLIVAFASYGHGVSDRLPLSVAGLAYAAVTGVTLYAAGHVHRRASTGTVKILSRIAGILLTAIAVSLLIDGSTRLVLDTLRAISERT
jgi:multiple antibiotic resistance protein